MLFNLLVVIFLFIILHENIKKIFNLINLRNFYKSSNTSVYINIKEGLGNRLMSFAGIIALSLLYKSKPYSIYLYIFLLVLNWKEFDLFYYFPFYNISKTSSQLNYSVVTFNISDEICINNFNNLKGKKYKNDLFFEFIWCDIIYELINNKHFYRNIKRYIPYEDYNRISYIYYIYFYIFNNLLMLKKYIKNKVNNFIKLHKQFIGIQMRLGNSDLRERRISVKKDIDLMIQLAVENFSNVKWFLTGDSISLKMKLKMIYKNIILYSVDKTKHFNKYPNDEVIIIEHELLSNSMHFIISRSTFGLTSLLKSGHLLNQRKKQCYEVKKGNVFNIQNEFIKFHSLI